MTAQTLTLFCYLAAWAGLIVVGFLQWFALRRLLKEAGLRASEMSSFPPFLGYFRQLRKVREIRSDLPNLPESVQRRYATYRRLVVAEIALCLPVFGFPFIASRLF